MSCPMCSCSEGASYNATGGGTKRLVSKKKIQTKTKPKTKPVPKPKSKKLAK